MKTISLFPSLFSIGVLAGINYQNTFATTHLTTGEPQLAKRLITKNFKIILEQIQPSAIKVGKTGHYNNRAKAKVYKDFSQMYILYKTTSIEFAETIEDLFIKYAQKNYNDICKNVKQGSAGVMKSKNGFYYVYLALVE